MPIHSQLLFFLAGLGVFNGLLLCGYLFFLAKPKRWLNLLLGFLLLALCIRIGKSIFHVYMDLDRIYRQIGLSACIMIGPFLYLYVQNFMANRKEPGTKEKVHIFLPLLSVIGLGIIWPYEEFPKFWNTWMVKGIYLTWIIYSFAAWWEIKPLLQKIRQRESGVSEHWLLLLVTCTSLICLAYNLAYYGFPYLAGPLLFSLVLYVILSFLFNTTNRAIILEAKNAKYQKQKVSTAKADELLIRLEQLMQKEQVFLDTKIKLAQIAQAIDSTPHELSQVINDRLGFSFNHYINEYRIKAACTLLSEADHLSIEGIGQEVGFNSRSAFYQAFKARMQQTPAKFRAEIKYSGD